MPKRIAIIRGQAYDITHLDHPGGDIMADLAVGRDCTIMYESSHLRMEVADAALSKLPKLDLPKLKHHEFDKIAEDFSTPGESEFYQAVRERVRKEVVRGGSRRSVPVWHWAAVIASWLACAAWFVQSPGILSGMVLGLTLQWVGTGVQHTANHGGLTKNKTFNWLLGLTNDLSTGGSSLVWRYHHQVGHHPYCNDHHKDQDVFSSYPLIRLDAHQPVEWYHKYQVFYAPLMFSFLYLSVMSADITQLIQGAIFDTRFLGTAKSEIALAWGLKFVHVSWIFLLPMYLHGFTAMLLPWIACLGFGSFVLALSFIVSHNLLDTKPGKGCGVSAHTKKDWAKWQVETSASWGGEIASFFTGGLNLQIEHHMFPCLAHHFYPAIQPILEEECRKHGVKYNKFGGLHDITVALFGWLHRMGYQQPLADEQAESEIRPVEQQPVVKPNQVKPNQEKPPRLWKPLLIVVAYQMAQEYYVSQWTEEHTVDFWTGVVVSKPLIGSVLYLGMIALGRKYMASREPSPGLRKYIYTYNLYQVCLNAWCVYIFIKEAAKLYFYEGVGPFTVSLSQTSDMTNFLIWVHYNNKFVELLDTFFMVANKKTEQLSFLHVYHHVLLVWSWYAVCRYGGAGGMAWFNAMLNSLIHVFMYSYYMLAALKVECPWKKVLTKLQMFQFMACMSTSLYSLYNGQYPRMLCYLNIWVMVNMLVLFGNFYRKRYAQAALKKPANLVLEPTSSKIKAN
eukprot:TRINITY_DN404_c0_g1_i7.p1 TRINITY_DN404_c0_g1~~TRINITY_DN404_c0_g1_i7.p1  ORF type:complete len:733 (+),score=154.11 TRINITY_DN404_c0_g1_i7:183-2381(+)